MLAMHEIHLEQEILFFDLASCISYVCMHGKADENQVPLELHHAYPFLRSRKDELPSFTGLAEI